MEVHKHPHHVTHKKKWTEYLLEFFMLFLAVFLGFVAENVRENSVEREREKQYMESFITDLQNDTATLVAGFRLKDERVRAIDSVFLFFESHHDVKTVPGIIFRNMYRTIWDRHYRRNSTTIDQLKNAGGLRLIRKKIVADSIAAYDLKWERADFWRESYMNNLVEAKDLLHKIFDANDLLFYYRTGAAGTTLQAPVTDSIKNINIYSADLNEYLNFLHDQKITTTQDENGYKQLMASAVRLIELIKREYNLK
jgi:hypothetical protein